MYVKKFGITFSVGRHILQRVPDKEVNEIIRSQKAAAMAKAELMIDAEVTGVFQIRYGNWVRHDPAQERPLDPVAAAQPVEYRRYLYLYRPN